MLAGVLVVMTALAGVMSASAQRERRSDPIGDVVRVTEHPNGSSEREALPNRRNGDIVSTRATHGDHRVSVVVRYAELKRRDHMQLRAPIRVFKNGRSRQYQLVSTNWLPRDSFTRPLLLVGPNPADMADTQCDAVTASVDFVTNVWRASVSRDCLRRPYSVVVKSAYYRQLSFDRDTETYLSDRSRVDARLHRGE